MNFGAFAFLSHWRAGLRIRDAESGILMSEEKLVGSLLFGDWGNGQIEIRPDDQVWEAIIFDLNGGQWGLTYTPPESSAKPLAKLTGPGINIPLIPDPCEQIDEAMGQLRTLFIELHGTRSKKGRNAETEYDFLQKLALAMREAGTEDTEFIAKHYPIAGPDKPNRGTDEATLYAAARRHGLKLSEAKQRAKVMPLREMS
jgi:hypothetical protein